MQLITLRTFESSIEAYLLKSRLEHEGVPCFIFDEHIVTQLPTYSLLVGGIKVKVFDLDYERAGSLVTRLEASPIINQDGLPVHCPECQSTVLYNGFKNMRGIRGIVSLLIALFFGVIPMYFQTGYKCRNCGAWFRSPVETPTKAKDQAGTRA